MTVTTAHPVGSCPWLLSGQGHCPRCKATLAEARDAHALVMRRFREKRRAVERHTMIYGFLSEAA